MFVCVGMHVRVCAHAVNQAIVEGHRGSAVVTFIDMCPECSLGSVDVTQELFQVIAGPLVIGRQRGIRWRFI